MIATFWCPGPTDILLWRICIWISRGFDVIRYFCDNNGLWWALRTVIFNNQVQVGLCFHSDTLNTNIGAVIRQLFAEDLRANRVVGLVEAAAPLGIQLINPNIFSWPRLSAGICFAILEILFPFFVEFRLFPLK
jgi:hypothetical protein